MNSTFRGAVEEVNLCRNSKSNDVLFAECIRTFSSHGIDGRSWMYRLEAFKQSEGIKEFQEETYIPPTKRPNVRTERSKPNEMDIYGFRPLQHPWRLLSVYEFLMAWRAEPLLVPSYYKNKGVREQTAWTEKGLQLIKTKAYKDGNDVAKPGIHYVVVEPEAHEYYTFPEHPADIYRVFRHAWVLIRKKRPDVVVIEGLKLPSSSRSDIENAKYCSLFFRPWTLLNGDTQVPHLALLGCGQAVLRQVYDVSRTPASKIGKVPETQPRALQDHVQWQTTWDAYVRGHVVSDTAAQLIKSFLLKTLAASGSHENDDDHSEADKSDEDADMQPLKLSRAGLKALLVPPCLEPTADNECGENN